MNGNGYDLHVQSNYSGGESTIKEIISRAQQLQLHAICVADALPNVDQFRKREAEIKSLLPQLVVLQGVIIQAKNAHELKSKVDSWRDVADIIIVAGGSVEINRAAAENSKVDIIAFPEKDRKDSGVDEVIAKEAAANKVAIELNFSEYLKTFKKIRSYVLSHMKRNAMLCQQYDAPIIVTSGAKSVWEMRTARDLAALAFLADMDREKAVRTTQEVPEMLIRNVMERRDKNFVRPGVRIVEE